MISMDTIINTAVATTMAIVPVMGGWAWRAQSDITTLMARHENEKEWREDLRNRLERLESKIDDLRPQQSPPQHHH